MKDGKKCTGVVLSAGSGSRMGSETAKQYLDLGGKPVIWYSLNAMEQSDLMDDVILVAGEGDIGFVREEIVGKYGFSKVRAVIAGGAERYLSVWEALKLLASEEEDESKRKGYVFIHDGARPFLTEEMLGRLADGAAQFHACAAAVPSKDTVKITDDAGFALQTPDRRAVWCVQTPQVFDMQLIIMAYERLMSRLRLLREQGIAVTDDAGVVEMFTDSRVKMINASYRNIKITTPEDMAVAKALLEM